MFSLSPVSWFIQPSRGWGCNPLSARAQRGRAGTRHRWHPPNWGWGWPVPQWVCWCPEGPGGAAEVAQQEPHRVQAHLCREVPRGWGPQVVGTATSSGSSLGCCWVSWVVLGWRGTLEGLILTVTAPQGSLVSEDPSGLKGKDTQWQEGVKLAGSWGARDRRTPCEAVNFPWVLR